MAVPPQGRYTAPVRVRDWRSDRPAAGQLAELLDEAARPGFLVVRFEGGGGAGELAWRRLEAWTRSRAVTVADVAADLAGCGLAVALCCDLVFVRSGGSLQLPAASAPPPSPAVVWALRRAGIRALARGLLGGGPIGADAAVALGLAHDRAPDDGPLPLPSPVSEAALTAARDLLRARSGSSRAAALEMASFRLLFAGGDPEEGARAFLDKREPEFEGHEG